MQIDNSVFRTTENTGNVILISLVATIPSWNFERARPSRVICIVCLSKYFAYMAFFLYLSKTYFYRCVVILDAV